jgi:hypothetical protein
VARTKWTPLEEEVPLLLWLNYEQPTTTNWVDINQSVVLLTMPPIKSYPHTTKVWSNCCGSTSTDLVDPDLWSRSTKANTYIAGNGGVAADASQPLPTTTTTTHNPNDELVACRSGDLQSRNQILYIYITFYSVSKVFFWMCKLWIQQLIL